MKPRRTFQLLLIGLMLTLVAVAAICAISRYLRAWEDAIMLVDGEKPAEPTREKPVPVADPRILIARIRAIETAVAESSQVDFPKELAWVLNDQVGWKELRILFLGWSKNDPAAASKWAASNLPRGPELSFALKTGMAAWAVEDRESAILWGQHLPNTEGKQLALRTIIETIAKDDPKQAAALLASMEELGTAALAIGTIADYWAAKDLAAAMKWAWALPPGPGRRYALSNIARKLIESDVNAAEFWAKRRPLAAPAGKVPDSIAELWRQKGAAEALAWIGSQLPADQQLDTILQVHLMRWAGENGADAAVWAEILADERGKEHALRVVAKMIGRSNPATAAILIARMPSGKARTEAIVEVISEWVEEDPEAATEWAEMLDDTEEKQLVLDEIAEVVEDKEEKEEDTEEEDQDMDQLLSQIFFMDRSLAIGLVEQLPEGQIRNGLVHTLAVDWAKEDPEAGTAWAMEQLPDGQTLDMALQVIVWNWVKGDAGAATGWADALEDDYRREHALCAVSQSLARSDPEGAVNVLASVPDGDKKNNTINNVAFQWASLDIDDASAWAQGLSVSGGKEYALLQVGVVRARSDVGAATAWAQSLSAGAERDSALGGIAYAQSFNDVKAALALAEPLLEGPGRQRALQGISLKLTQQDPTSAAAWLETLASGESRDLAIESFVSIVIGNDPELASEWQAQIGQ